MLRSLLVQGVAISLACSSSTAVEPPVESRQRAADSQPSVAPAPEAAPRCPDDPAAWAGEWRLSLLLWSDVEEAEETAIASTYELTIDVVDPKRLRVTMRGPDPWTGAPVEGTADWQRECERIAVSHMRLSNATGAHADLAFELRLDGDRLWGIYGLYDQHATDRKTAYFFEGHPLAAAAARDHAPPSTKRSRASPASSPASSATSACSSRTACCAGTTATMAITCASTSATASSTKAMGAERRYGNTSAIGRVG